MTLELLKRMVDVNGRLVQFWLDYLQQSSIGKESYVKLVDLFQDVLDLAKDLNDEIGECVSYVSSISDLAEFIDPSVKEIMPTRIITRVELLEKVVQGHSDWKDASEFIMSLRACKERLFSISIIP